MHLRGEGEETTLLRIHGGNREIKRDQKGTPSSSTKVKINPRIRESWRGAVRHATISTARRGH